MKTDKNNICSERYKTKWFRIDLKVFKILLIGFEINDLKRIEVLKLKRDFEDFLEPKQRLLFPKSLLELSEIKRNQILMFGYSNSNGFSDFEMLKFSEFLNVQKRVNINYKQLLK